jgi:hypothetical protein
MLLKNVCSFYTEIYNIIDKQNNLNLSIQFVLKNI